MKKILPFIIAGILLVLPFTSLGATFDMDSPLVGSARATNLYPSDAADYMNETNNILPYNHSNLDSAKLIVRHVRKPKNLELIYFLSNTERPTSWRQIDSGETIEFRQPGDDLYLRVSGTRTFDDIRLGEVIVKYRKKIGEAGGRRRDRERFNNIQKLDDVIVDFYHRHNQDPKVRSPNHEDRIRVLLRLLRLNEFIDFDHNHFKDPLHSDSKYDDAFYYDYKSDREASSFVLSARMERRDSPYLSDDSPGKLNDLDGNVLGIDCDDPVYCIGRGPKIENKRRIQDRDEEIRESRERDRNRRRFNLMLSNMQAHLNRLAERLNRISESNSY